MHAAIGDLEDAGGQLVDEIAVVRDEDHRAGELFKRFEQHFLGAQVQVIGGLVEQQEIGRHHQHAGQRVAVALAAGEHADGLEDVVFGEQEAAQDGAQLGVGGARGDLAQVVEHAGVGVELLILILREVVRLGVVAERVFAGR